MEGKAYLGEDVDEYVRIVSKTFSSEKEGYRFYNQYAFRKGFSVRKDYVRHDRTTKEIIHRRLMCFREGYRRARHMDKTDRQKYPRSLTRRGCKAEFAISLDNRTGEWFVKIFIDVHNHPLSIPGEVGFLWSHHGLTDAQKAEALELKEGELRKYQVMEIMENEYGEFEQVGFTSKDLYNFFQREAKKHITGGDADKVIKQMTARQEEDMEYFFDYETDNEGRLTRLFWSDPQSRMDYGAFGEVVVFDSTYRVNKYNLPFIPFVGVNHHGATVIFGCGILSDETQESYEWLLSMFLVAMGQRHPISVITDGDAAMRIAIEHVMPNSTHRLCVWHIEQNMIRHLNTAMLPDFRSLVYSQIGPDDFEKKWTEFIERYDVSQENSWISRMYNLRRKWATAYIRGGVYLGMKSNQRSESLNSRLHKNLDRNMSLLGLVQHYERCLSHMRRTEAQMDAKASQSVSFTSRMATSIEKDAANIFTPDAFMKVKSEMYRANYYEVSDIINDSTSVTFVLVVKEKKDKTRNVNTVFQGQTLSTISCGCQKLECERIPCRHIFVVLHHINMQRTPQCCIFKRWTKKAKHAFPSDRYGEGSKWSDRMERFRQLRRLGNDAMFKASINEETAEEVMKALTRILEVDNGCSIEKEATIRGPEPAATIDSNAEKVGDPKNVMSRGAPTKRMLSFFERPKKKRVVHCGFCRAPGHTIRSCEEYKRKHYV